MYLKICSFYPAGMSAFPRLLAREIIQTCFEYEYTIRCQYALLEDCSLWRWEASIYPWGQVARAFWTVVISVVLGIIVGIILLAGIDHR